MKSWFYCFFFFIDSLYFNEVNQVGYHAQYNTNQNVPVYFNNNNNSNKETGNK